MNNAKYISALTRFFLLIGLVALGSVASAAKPPNPGRFNAPIFAKAPIIDGDLTDEVWTKAEHLTDFRQIYPGDNSQPSEQTEVLIGYDTKNLYIGLRAYEKKDKVRASVAKRDNVENDDYFAVYLDTFNDKQKAYLLEFNPLGIQQDGIYTEGTGADYSFDLQMTSKGVVTADGFSIEVAIPFHSLRYQPGRDRAWGLHVLRYIKYNNNEKDSLMPVTRGKTNFLEQAGQLAGLTKIDGGRSIEITPSLNLAETGKRVRRFPQSASNPAIAGGDVGHFVNSPLKASPGVTVKANLTSNIVLDAAINPDFAQVEADQLVVTANQRYPIFFEEKRPFFLEGAEIFKTPIAAVYTRTIVDPDWAVKLSGKTGRNSFGFLAASDNAPGNYDKEELADPVFRQSVAKFVDKNAFVGIARFKRDIGSNSNVGVLAGSYDFVEQHNRFLGVDGRLAVDPRTVFSFQVIGTNSKKRFYDPATDTSPYRTGNGFSYYAQLARTGRHFNWSLVTIGKSPFYQTDTGYVPETNINNWNANLRYDSEPRPHGKLVSWSVANTFLAKFDWQGRMKYAYVNPNITFNFQKETFFRLTVYRDYLRLFEEEFGPKRSATQQGAFFGAPERSTSYPGFTTEFGTTPSKKYTVSVSADWTWHTFDYDFGGGPRFPRVSPAALADPANPNAPLDPGVSTSFDFSSSFGWRPTDKLNVTMNYTKSRLVREDTLRTAYDQNLPSFKTTYQFNASTFARVRIDYDSLQSRMQGQFLVGWTPHPGTAIYAGFNNDMNYNGFNPFTGVYEPRWVRNGETYFVKMSWLFKRNI